MNIKKSNQFEKGHIPWSKGTKGIVKPNSGSFKKGIHYNLGKKHSVEHIENFRLSRKGYRHTEETKSKLGLKSKKHPKWKGDKVGYGALHQWVSRNYGIADRCDNLVCCFKNPKKYEWSNISGKYSRERTDWIRLCPSCHRKFDNGSIKIAYKIFNNESIKIVYKSHEQKI